MNSVAYDIPELFHWIDCFCFSTRLSPSSGARIYSELMDVVDMNDVFSEISHRSSTFKRFIGDKDHEAVRAYRGDIICNSLEYVLRTDADKIKKRDQHYTNVLKHHGFSKKFIQEFMMNLRPDSVKSPEPISVDPVFTKHFNPEPFFGKRDKSRLDYVLIETNMSDDPDFQDSFFDSIRISRPIIPTGLVSLMRYLGFKVDEIQTESVIPISSPRFKVTDTDGQWANVFITGISKAPGDEEDSAVNSYKEMLISENFSFDKTLGRSLILFYGNPASFREEGGAPGNDVTFWGEVFVNGSWHEMILNQDSKSINKIIEQAIAWGKSESLNPEVFGDKDSLLLHHFLDNHEDPLEGFFSLFENI